MIRRAAAGLPQAKGTGFLPARRASKPNAVPAEAPQSRSKAGAHRLRTFCFCLLLLAAALFAAAWYWTGEPLDFEVTEE